MRVQCQFAFVHDTKNTDVTKTYAVLQHHQVQRILGGLPGCPGSPVSAGSSIVRPALDFDFFPNNAIF